MNKDDLILIDKNDGFELYRKKGTNFYLYDRKNPGLARFSFMYADDYESFFIASSNNFEDINQYLMRV